jgi:hypothetical protein
VHSKAAKGAAEHGMKFAQGFFVKEAKNKAKQDCFAVAIAIS